MNFSLFFSGSVKGVFPIFMEITLNLQAVFGNVSRSIMLIPRINEHREAVLLGWKNQEKLC